MTNETPRTVAFKDTNDLGFAAYAHMRGLKVVKAVKWKRERAIEYQFTFDDSGDAWHQLEIDFANSESLNFDSSVRTLKKLCAKT